MCFTTNRGTKSSIFHRKILRARVENFFTVGKSPKQLQLLRFLSGDDKRAHSSRQRNYLEDDGRLEPHAISQWPLLIEFSI